MPKIEESNPSKKKDIKRKTISLSFQTYSQFQNDGKSRLPDVIESFVSVCLPTAFVFVFFQVEL